MLWLFFSALAYLLNATAETIDKFLLNKKISNPAVYAFFISALSLLGVVIAPFGFSWQYAWWQFAVGLVSGGIFAFAYLFMFKALAKNEASRVIPFMGGWQPIFVLILAFVFLGERLPWHSLAGFALIVAGTILISRQKSQGRGHSGYFLALLSTLLFAIAYTISKYLYDSQDFGTAFVTARVGTFLGALLLLFSATNRRDIVGQLKHGEKQTGALFVGGQICGALSFLLVNYAIALSNSVAIVNALRGLEYVFLLLLVIALSKKFPRLLEEKMTPKILTQKIIATALIIGGLAALFI